MRTRRSLTGAAVLVFSLTAAACSDDSSTKPIDAATTLPGGQFCDAMGQLIVAHEAMLATQVAFVGQIDRG